MQHTPSIAGCLPNCLFIYPCLFPAPRTHTGAGGKPRPAPKADPKINPKGGGGSFSPPFPRGSREALARKGVGAGRGDAGGITHPLCLRIAASKEWLQRATKSVLSRGSCKLFAAPGNQHLGFQSPPGPFLPCQKPLLPFSKPHMSCQQSMNTGSLPGNKGE